MEYKDLTKKQKKVVQLDRENNVRIESLKKEIFAKIERLMRISENKGSLFCQIKQLKEQKK